MSSSIRYVRRADLDLKKWDDCIANAQNGLIYGFSFYLDQMGKHWDALVLDDYMAVMPLTWNKKAGFSYLYQPALTPSLGVFGNDLREDLVAKFIQSIPNKFRLVEISLNEGNEFPGLHQPPLNALSRKNYVLDLNQPYEDLYSNYNDNIRRNIKKSLAVGCIVQKKIPIENIVSLVKNQFKSLTVVKDSDYENFTSLYTFLAQRQQVETYGIFLKGQLISTAAYFFSHKRAYYIMAGNHPNGKTVGASHYLIDRFIADHANRDLVLDFEGSDISSLAFFYSSFGSTLKYFPALRINRLPWYVKWFK